MDSAKLDFFKNTIKTYPDYSFKEIKDIPIVIFDSHKLAFPIWGLLSKIHINPHSLITFDTHTDTRAPLCVLQSENRDKSQKEIFSEPQLFKKTFTYKQSGHIFLLDRFDFHKVYNGCKDLLFNDEQIQTAYCFDHIDSYFVICKDKEYHSKLKEDISNSYDAVYHHAKDIGCLSSYDFKKSHYILDFDLDFFNSQEDFSDSLLGILQIIKDRVELITIAREPKFFEKEKVENCNYNIDIAEQLLLDMIKKVF